MVQILQETAVRATSAVAKAVAITKQNRHKGRGSSDKPVSTLSKRERRALEQRRGSVAVRVREAQTRRSQDELGEDEDEDQHQEDELVQQAAAEYFSDRANAELVRLCEVRLRKRCLRSHLEI